jgi:hypothetical protein
MCFNACVCVRYVIIHRGQANPVQLHEKRGDCAFPARTVTPDRIIAMLNRLGELISQSNFKQFHTAASDTYRSLHSFCNSRTVWSQKSGVKDKGLLLTPDFRLQTSDCLYTGDKSY